MGAGGLCLLAGSPEPSLTAGLHLSVHTQRTQWPGPRTDLQDSKPKPSLLQLQGGRDPRLSTSQQRTQGWPGPPTWGCARGCLPPQTQGGHREGRAGFLLGGDRHVGTSPGESCRPEKRFGSFLRKLDIDLPCGPWPPGCPPRRTEDRCSNKYYCRNV